MADLALVMQPPDSSLCGQACVATIAGISLAESISLFGSKGATTTRQVVEALNAKGFNAIQPAVRHYRGQLPDETLVCRFRRGKGSHWVVWSGGKFYDPGWGVSWHTPPYLLAADAKVTSYIRVLGRRTDG